MEAHAVISELLGAWALDACDDAEMASVEQHLLDCAECAAQARRLRAAASWLSVDRVQPAPAHLRQATLARARAVRPPVLLATLVEAYAGQVTVLGRLLDSISTDDWRRAEPRHGDVAGVVAHLAGNDGMLADDLGLSVPLAPTTRRRRAGNGVARRSFWCGRWPTRAILIDRYGWRARASRYGGRCATPSCSARSKPGSTSTTWPAPSAGPATRRRRSRCVASPISPYGSCPPPCARTASTRPAGRGASF